MRKICLAAIFAFAPHDLLAQDNSTSPTVLFGHDFGITQIYSETSFYFSLNDSVSDGCWLNPGRAINNAKRVFLDAGYTNIVEQYSFGVTIRLSAIGYATSDYQCAVFVNFEVGVTDSDRRTFYSSEWFSVIEKVSFERGALLTGPKSGISMRINDAFAEYVDEFIVHIQQEKNRLRTAIGESDAGDVAKAELLNSIIR